MTDITADCTYYYGTLGDLKMIEIVTSAAADTSDTIDLGTDSAAGKINTILNTLVQDDLGADVTSTWDPATGIITLGTITSGIHNILVIGK
jgi:hypothetical protein